MGVAQNKRLKARSAPWIDLAELQYALTDKKQRVFASIHYGARSWDKSRRVIVKAEHSSHGANPRFVVTNLPQTDQFRQLLSGLAYTLFEGLRRKALENTSLAKASPNTIRLTLLKIGAVVIRNRGTRDFPS